MNAHTNSPTATLREIVGFLLDQVATHCPAPPSDELRRVAEIADELCDEADREPALGWNERGEIGTADDREDESDFEPSLGWTETKASAWGFRGSETGGVYDLEDEHDGREPSDDDEPSLGWTSGGACGPSSDLEGEHDGAEPEGV
ncbi:MAG: hypothetical protein ACFE0P_00420 [Oceanicaulis sp.]